MTNQCPIPNGRSESPPLHPLGIRHWGLIRHSSLGSRHSALARTFARGQAAGGLAPRPMLAHPFPAAALPQTVFSRNAALAGCKAGTGRRTPNHPPSLPAMVLANHVHCWRQPSCDLGNREALPWRLRRYPRAGEADAVDQVQDLAHLPCSFPGGHRDASESTRSPTILRWCQVKMLAERASQVFWDSSVPGRPARRGP